MKENWLTVSHYIDLYKFYQTRADNVKTSMFSTATWIIGFAIGLLGFVFATLVKYDDQQMVVQHRLLALLACVLGLVLCLYATFFLADARNHITRNRNRSNAFKRQVCGMDDLVDVYDWKTLFRGEWDIRIR